MNEMLSKKRILIVDGEQDVLESLEELLDACIIDTTSNFETAKKLLEKKSYDAAIIDIIGVKGSALLKLVKQKKIPALMLTAHDISAQNRVKSIRGGACSYIPKHKMADIDSYLADVIRVKSKGSSVLKNMV
ncbi:MAG: response regulator [Desulfobacterales bacterium]|jgi:DNA-binding NtrC family response regulator